MYDPNYCIILFEISVKLFYPLYGFKELVIPTLYVNDVMSGGTAVDRALTMSVKFVYP